MRAADLAMVVDSAPSDLRRVKQAGGAFLVSTPFRFGAKNWVLSLETTSDRLTAIRFRTEDSLKERPTNAPSDVQVQAAKCP